MLLEKTAPVRDDDVALDEKGPFSLSQTHKSQRVAAKLGEIGLRKKVVWVVFEKNRGDFNQSSVDRGAFRWGLSVGK